MIAWLGRGEREGVGREGGEREKGAGGEMSPDCQLVCPGGDGVSS